MSTPYVTRIGRAPSRARILMAGLIVAFAGFAGLSEPTASAADPNGDTAPEVAYARVQGGGGLIAYDVVDGLAIIDHDIILGTHAELQADGAELPGLGAPACPADMACGAINTAQRHRWPQGVVPYSIPAGTPGDTVANIEAAVAHWEDKTSISFVPRTSQPDYIEFVGSGAGNTCSSYVGRVGGRQPINFAGNGRGCLVHEIGHAIGLDHEQNRNDRDDHITIDYTNIAGNAASQFRKAAAATDVGPYDFSSVMHYSAYAFALDRSRPVIIPKDPSIPLSAVGGRGVLTPSDVQAVEHVYGTTSPPPTTTPSTIGTSTTTQPTTTSTTRPSVTSTSRPTTTVTESTVTLPMPPTTTAPAPRPTTSQPTTSQPTTSQPKPPPSVGPATTTGPTTTVRPGRRNVDARPPVATFVGLDNGGTVPSHVPYGGIRVEAYDPDIGTVDGSGIRRVTLVLTDAGTGRFIAARTEYRPTFDWGVELRPGRSYTLTAYAVATRSAGGGRTQVSLTVTAAA